MHNHIYEFIKVKSTYNLERKEYYVMVIKLFHETSLKFPFR
jgi:hypothetical protein